LARNPWPVDQWRRGGEGSKAQGLAVDPWSLGLFVRPRGYRWSGFINSVRGNWYGDPRADRGAYPRGIPNGTVRGRQKAVGYGTGHGYGEQTLRC
jgi:hypothetical protein